MRILLIAQNTFRETIRDRVLRVIVALCFVLIIASRGIAEISLGQELKIIADFSLGAIDIFGAVLCVFIGTGLIYKEIDKRTLYTVLAHPLPRWEFIVGKYLGMVATVSIAVLLMGGVFWGYFLLSGGQFHWNMAAAILLLIIGLMLLNAIAIFFSTMSSPTVSAIATIAIFIIGRGTEAIKFIAENFYPQSMVKNFILGLYYFLPNFHNFNIKLAAVHQLPIASPLILFRDALIYCFVYSAIMLYLASLIFQKRNL